MSETVRLSRGDLQVRVEGTGPTVLFVHGALVNGRLWDATVARLGAGFRCVVPEMPFGSHALPLPPRADRTPQGQADRLAELLEVLDLRDVTLVGNDSGGAVCQLLVASAPERIGRLVLTNCDAFEAFPPAAFAWLAVLPRYPRVMAAISHLLARLPVLGRGPTAYGRLTRRRIAPELLRAWTAPGADPRIRADIAGFLAAVGPDVLPAIVPGLRRFDREVVLAWGASDPFFTIALARRLADAFPRATLRPIDDCATYVPLDAPERLAREIAALVAGTSDAAPARAAGQR